MRCDEVIRELTEPTPAVDAVAVAAHVAACPGCARADRELRHLDALWSASRPEGPPAGSFDRIWAAVASQAEGPDVLPIGGPSMVGGTGPGGRRRWLVPALGVAILAQAAALLIAVGTLFRTSETTPAVASRPSIAPAVTTPSQVVEFELEEGQTLFLELSGADGRVVCRPRFVNTSELVAFDGEDDSNAFAVAYQADITMLNVMEGMDGWPRDAAR